jgi:hypothetical protein
MLHKPPMYLHPVMREIRQEAVSLCVDNTMPFYTRFRWNSPKAWSTGVDQALMYASELALAVSEQLDASIPTDVPRMLRAYIRKWMESIEALRPWHSYIVKLLLQFHGAALPANSMCPAEHATLLGVGVGHGGGGDKHAFCRLLIQLLANTGNAINATNPADVHREWCKERLIVCVTQPQRTVRVALNRAAAPRGDPSAWHKNDTFVISLTGSAVVPLPTSASLLPAFTFELKYTNHLPGVVQEGMPATANAATAAAAAVTDTDTDAATATDAIDAAIMPTAARCKNAL